MYQHLSKTAKEVLRLAEQLAQQVQQEYVGTEHVLLAILDHGLGLGAQVLDNASITLEAVKDQIQNLTKKQMEETWVLGRLPGTPHFKQVIAMAIEEAEKVKDRKIGTEYLLLGILREKDCVAERALRNLGLNLKSAHKEVARLQGRPG
ncbi:MAG: ATP-dependent Clp protease ATP-binding subunit [Planctomycetes bacterium]|nr:ATP-dependent Clp protease ATP-binding subunit [Planctomycetota bacterium]